MICYLDTKFELVKEWNIFSLKEGPSITQNGIPLFIVSKKPFISLLEATQNTIIIPEGHLDIVKTKSIMNVITGRFMNEKQYGVYKATKGMLGLPEPKTKSFLQEES